ncbi:MAG: (d)CMP kinase [Clostridia bacterium]|nr:(d)CMP kinase [Clostridia bacterium]
MNHFNIAIDGPSGAGKSTIAKALSSKLGISYLDTGALYRAVGLKAYRDGWEENDEIVSRLLGLVDIKVSYDEEGKQHVYLDGEDVSTAIRQDFVSGYGSRFSALPSVRKALLDLQRRVASEYSSVLDGRDIGTSVLPNAKYKIYLTASPEIRAKRRYDELIAKGQTVEFDKVLADINERDFRDMNRAISPLKKADDAVEINSDNMSIEEVIKFVVEMINENV